MTISTSPSPISYNGDDSTASFSITWKYFAKSHVVVTLRESDGDEVTWVLGTQYTLSDAQIESGGTLTVSVSPTDFTPATGETLLIELVVPNTQDSSLPLGGPFPSSVVEDELDQAAQRDEKIQAVLDRCIKVPKTDTATDLVLPIDSSRAGEFFSFDGSGNVTSAAGTSADLTAVSTFINTLLDDADAVSARQTLLIDTSGADINSASTIDLDAATGDFVDVTGTVTITAITLGDGVEKTVRFTGTLLLTHGASLVLEGNASIQTAAGDMAVFRGDASSVVRMVEYMRLQPHGANIVAATTTNLDTATGDLVDITGTTTITGLTLSEGKTRTVRFTDALTLTHGASLVLPGSANITTVAGDYAIFRAYSGGVVRCVSYQPINFHFPSADGSARGRTLCKCPSP